MDLIAAHVEMMNRLTAEEGLVLAKVTAAATGSVKAASARATLTDLERDARGRRRGGRRATAGQIEAIGIGCRVVERSAE